ncbi:S-layer homology domain-containing protein [Paenibacillus sp. YPG26]|uniref:S-layer homology domain-containing protein n=1 Tax=Paenibacillus sp. YPG26 TaxID=2878915 RepID=UPI002041D2A6|nr:S-layer homology domain-containing protein [Paenibacillus sp. YPG26]USB32860.1 S-layer homology domain-containing protein [Paenibacillus sp. YPG26]
MSNTSYTFKENSYMKDIQGGDKKVMKKILSVALSTAMAFSMFASVAFGAESTLTPQQQFDALSAKGILNGYPDGSAHLEKTVTRGELAKVIVKTLGLKEVTGVFSYKDKNYNAKNWAAPYIEAVTAAGIMQGKDTAKKIFDFNGNVTAEELATVLVRALKLEVPTTGIDNSATAWAKGYVQAAINAGLLEKSTNFQAAATRSQVVVAAYVVDQKNTLATVTGVSVASPNTLTVTGTGLGKLTAAQVTVGGVAATAISASADGKTATVTLASNLLPNAESTVVVTLDGKATEYKVTNGVVVNSVQVQKAAYDQQLKGQKVKFTINGQSTPVDVDYLALAGYSVTFVATKNGAVANILDNGAGTATNSNNTGALLSATAIPAGEYNIEVQIVKGSTVVTGSEKITVANLSTAATAVGDVVLYSFGADKTDESSANYNGTLAGDDFLLNSTTLVAGEKAQVYNVKATIAGVVGSAPAGSVSVTTSNPAVVSVNGKVLTAESAGTATLTITVGGNVTKTVNVTVTNSARAVKSITADPVSVNAVKGVATSVKLTAKDQYGDPFKLVTGAGAGNQVDEVTPAFVGAVQVETDTANKIGTQTLTFTPNATGTGTVYFKDKDGNIVGSFYVNATDVNNVASQKLEISGGESSDLTLDKAKADDDTVTFALNNYTTNGVKTTAETLTGYTVTSSNTSVATAAAPTGTTFVVTAIKAGTTQIVLKNAAGNFVAQATVTVVDNAPAIASVQFKSVPTIDYIGKTVSYKDVLNVTEQISVDPIVNGVTLKTASQYQVRLNVASAQLYLDTNGNGAYDAGTDSVLGTLVASIASGGTGNLATATPTISSVVTTARGDKGTILFKVLTDANDATTAVAATSVNVDVK